MFYQKYSLILRNTWSQLLSLWDDILEHTYVMKNAFSIYENKPLIESDIKNMPEYYILRSP